MECRVGRDSVELINNGWKVTALDIENIDEKGKY